MARTAGIMSEPSQLHQLHVRGREQTLGVLAIKARRRLAKPWRATGRAKPVGQTLVGQALDRTGQSDGD